MEVGFSSKYEGIKGCKCTCAVRICMEEGEEGDRNGLEGENKERGPFYVLRSGLKTLVGGIRKQEMAASRGGRERLKRIIEGRKKRRPAKGKNKTWQALCGKTEREGKTKKIGPISGNIHKGRYRGGEREILGKEGTGETK